METIQPGIKITENVVSQRSNDVFMGIPIFIGYTQPPASGNIHDNIIIKLNDLTDFTQSFKPEGLMYYSIRHFFDNGGQQAYMLSLGNEKTQKDLQLIITELQQNWLKQAIAAENQITLLIVPDTAQFSQCSCANINASAWLQLWTAVLNLCKIRHGIMGLLDAPDNPRLAANCFKQLGEIPPNDRQWGAVYWPSLNTVYYENDSTDKTVVISPTAAVAAIIQRYDREKGAWVAPANVQLAKVINPTCSYAEAQQWIDINEEPLNLIRSFPGKGIRIWGCRTLYSQPDFNQPDFLLRYIQTRRQISYIETYITKLGQAFVFEPNNAITWMKFKGQTHNWLRQLWLKGGLRGTQQEHAFEVLLGIDESMTEADLRDGKMIMKIKLALLTPAEFIELNLTFDSEQYKAIKQGET
ncbi:phage tail sheath C-terminal domain-containing protein [Xenorhabdus ishibashii]|uniref:Phage tail protein n=1 Tax=Xenorhabdus ishibashii TaxID=1034471 RepID=A0A2D0KAA0_9GAMM|nr:phage tail sheath C-terminal domain-containing protein [Xenorhabdus ishibashii]PHM60361.1 phage tail protein [Xenorhabdus ishibashii]